MMPGLKKGKVFYVTSQFPGRRAAAEYAVVGGILDPPARY